EAYLFSDFFERTIALIAIKLHGRAVIDDEEINIALIVEIGADDSRGFIFAAAEARLRGDVGEGAIAVVAEEFVFFARKIVGEYGLLFGGELREVGEIADEQIKIAVVVGVYPGRGHRPRFVIGGQARLFCHIAERSVAIVLPHGERLITKKRKVNLAI